MAKLGEGDSRWIVNDVGNAAANDNGWHWKEYDALEWSNKRLKEMFKFMTLIEDPHMKLEVTSLQSCDGEAFINNRKSKLIPSYELEVKLWWKGEAKDGEGKTSALAHGSIHFPYIADENHDEEPEVKFVCETFDPLSTKLKEAFQKTGKKLLIEQVELFVSELRAGGPVGAKELAKEAANKSAAASASSAAAGSQPGASKAAEAAPAPAPASKPKAPKPKGGLQTLKMTEKFYAKPSDIYECFTDENKIKAFTQSKASVEPKAGGKFSWFEGAVHGEFVEMEKDKHLVMKWKFSTWADSAWSKVDIRLELPEVGTTILNLVHTDIPEEDKFGQPVLETTEKGWKNQILQRIRQVFGYGV